MERKHLSLGAGLLFTLIAATALISYGVTSAQNVDCAYSFTPQSVAMTVTAGQSQTSTFRVSATGTGCATDSVTVQLWDTPAQLQWQSWCTPTSTPLGINSGSGADIVFTCTPPASGYLTYDPLIRLLRGTSVVNTAIFDLTINPAPAGSCTSLNLSVTPASVQTNTPVTLNYSCASPAAGTAPSSLTIRWSPPGTTYSTLTTIVAPVLPGMYTIPAASITQTGTYGIQACLDPACTMINSATFAVSSTTFNESRITLQGTIYKDGQFIDPATNAVRTCTAPNAWMKESTTSTGARSFHCMLNYTATAVDQPPSACSGTLWASNSGGFESDYCATSPSSTQTGLTSCPTGQMLCASTPPATGNYCHTGTTCPAATATTCNAPQIWCPAVGSSPAGCYNSPCPTIGTTPTTCITGQTMCYPSGGGAGYCATTCPTSTPPPTCAAGQIVCYPSSGGAGYCQTGTTCTTTTTPTSCAAGQTMCPAVGSSPAGCYTTCPTSTPTPTNGIITSGACPNGSRCASPAWCQNGSQCYYPNSEFTCVAWPAATTGTGTASCPAAAGYPECPVGTFECSSTDTSCIPTNQIVPYSSGKWCRYGMQYYSIDGANMICVKGGVAPPVGYTDCRPGDTSCIPSNGYGSSTGWCARGMKCYQKATDQNPNNDVACPSSNTMTCGPSSSVNCPDGYTKCSATDTNCRQVGESGSSDIWCTDGKKCTTSTGATCISWDKECSEVVPGAKSCDANQVQSGCLEINEEKIFTSTTSYPYCGGSGMVFYKGVVGSYTAKCVSRPQNAWSDPSWVPQVPAGYGFCRPNDNYCIEPGATGPSSGWCAWMPFNMYPPVSAASSSIMPATKTCPSLKGVLPPPPPPPPTQCSTEQKLCPPNIFSPVSSCVAKTALCPGDVPPPPPPPTEKFCEAGEGFGGVFASAATAVGYIAPLPPMMCQVPFWCWESSEWVKQKSSYINPPPYPPYASVSGTAASSPMMPLVTFCTSFRVEEFEAKTLWAKKWDPAKFGMWYWPNYKPSTPSYKLDTKTNTLVACKESEPIYYQQLSPDAYNEYQSPCQAMTEEDKPLWIAKFLAEKKMHDAWQKSRRDGPDPRICPQVTAYAKDPKTNFCKFFSLACNVPEGWITVPSCEQEFPCPAVVSETSCPTGKVLKKGGSLECPFNYCDLPREPGEICPLMPTVDFCPAGQTKVLAWSSKECGEYYNCVKEDPNMCRQNLRGYFDEVKGARFFLQDISRKLSNVPERTRDSFGELVKLVDSAKAIAKDLEKGLKGAVKGGKCDSTLVQDFETKLKILRETMMLINEEQEGLQVAESCQFFTKGLDERVSNLKKDAKRFEKQGEKEFAARLNAAAAKFEALKPKADAACESADRFALDDVQLAMGQIEGELSELFRFRHEQDAELFLTEKLSNIRAGIAFVRNGVRQRGLEAACQKADEHLKGVETILNEAEEALDEENDVAAGQKLAIAESRRDIVFEAFKQCGFEIEFRPEDRLDERLILEGSKGITEAVIERIVGKVVEKLTAKVEATLVFIDEKVKNLITAAQALQENTLKQMTQAISNIQKALQDNQEELDSLILSKEKVVAEVNAALESLKENRRLLSAADRTVLENMLNQAAATMFCGDIGVQVNQKVALIRQSIEGKEVTRDDVREFEQFMREVGEKNPNTCYDEGVFRFRDTPAEQYFFTAMNSPNSPFRGKFGPDGKPLGIVEPGRRALWMEGAMVVARAAGIEVDGRCDVPAAIPGATATPYGACALGYFLDHDVLIPHAVNETMTRVEFTQLVFSLIGNKVPVRGDATYIAGYRDVDFDDPAGQAIATMIANRLMVGKAEGRFAPNDLLTRAEIATVIQRFLELVQ